MLFIPKHDKSFQGVKLIQLIEFCSLLFKSTIKKLKNKTPDRDSVGCFKYLLVLKSIVSELVQGYLKQSYILHQSV